jgi:hypothetical protein
MYVHIILNSTPCHESGYRENKKAASVLFLLHIIAAFLPRVKKNFFFFWGGEGTSVLATNFLMSLFMIFESNDIEYAYVKTKGDCVGIYVCRTCRCFSNASTERCFTMSLKPNQSQF